MSSALVESQPRISPVQKLVTLADRVTVAPRTWFLVTCVLLSISGGIRFWRDIQFRAISKGSTTSPISLAALPSTFGRWHAVEGSDAELDPQIARIAGSSEHIMRSYRDGKSGEVVSVLVLYGLADGVFAHTPEVCYPAAGFQGVNIKSKDQVIELPQTKKPLEFRTAYFGKHVGGMLNCVQVSWTFRHNGQWLADVSKRWKSFRYYPGMFKIQIQRMSCEQGGEESATDVLLKDMADEIEKEIIERDAELGRRKAVAT